MSSFPQNVLTFDKYPSLFNCADVWWISSIHKSVVHSETSPLHMIVLKCPRFDSYPQFPAMSPISSTSLSLVKEWFLLIFQYVETSWTFDSQFNFKSTCFPSCLHFLKNSPHFADLSPHLTQIQFYIYRFLASKTS